MAKSLVIVESPAKAKTLKKYLGSQFQVLPSVGHVKDLPKSKLGVDVEKDFKPTYEVIRGKSKIIKEIVDAAAKVEKVFLAPDPDREGEAIAWHIAEEIEKKCKTKGGKQKSEDRKSKKPTIYRALFHEITKKAVQEAIAHPVELDANLYEAQQARRILDRLVGYKISPLLWDKVRRGLSAGRVQSVAVRIVCEREEEVLAFKAEEYWSVIGNFLGSKEPVFEAKLTEVEGSKDKKIHIPNQKNADTIVAELKKQKFVLKAIERKERKRNPVPPFITSHLQQEASKKLGFSAKKTMMLAQRLYEGVEVGEEGPVGLITYMRTDSTRVSQTALEEVREFILKQYEKDHLPAEPNIYKSKKGAQDAHEAIRPTSLQWTPEFVAAFMERDMLRLYDLIWKRFVASQMVPAIFDKTGFDIQEGKYLFRGMAQVIKFS